MIVWDVATGTMVRQFSGHTDQVNRAVFSPDGTRIVTASVDKTAIDDITTTRGFVGVSYHDKDGHQCWATHAYYCFPATLDPRGPKS